MPHSRKPSTAAGDHIEVLMYLRRKPGMSREEFYKHWSTVHARKVGPWAEKHGIHTHGTIIPNNIGIHSPSEPITTTELIQPVKFDGIAIYEFTSLGTFEAGFSDEIYNKDIAPDKKNFLDVDGLGGGVVARFEGRVWTMVEKGRSKVKVEESDEMRVWNLLGKRQELLNMQDEAPFR
ncbi:hypothetical protein EJ08DRAFT_626312 [Tothia fuscella]|uniref:EthD domain-containing protein n=1 Tax=Tothia fuscella TaxID=1048955 RepID=A0A9P4NYY3_9PEZI|nr:hypothetical protein EJ08DRAFT_626312 [Tothia fuscella]